MRIIPAIDIIEGKCVRLTQGNFSSRKTYNEHPLEVAKAFEDSGLEYLHLVDLDGAKARHIVNHKILKSIATKTNLKIDFGGGIKSLEDVQLAFDYGAAQITGGSIAVQQPEIFVDWILRYGSNRVLLGADCNDRLIATNGWTQCSAVDIINFIQDYEERGIRSVVCTDIKCDGTLQGPSVELYKEIISQTNVQLIASGGISSLQDIINLSKIGCEGAIIGKALYEGHISLSQLQNLC